MWLMTRPTARPAEKLEADKGYGEVGQASQAGEATEAAKAGWAEWAGWAGWAEWAEFLFWIKLNCFLRRSLAASR